MSARRTCQPRASVDGFLESRSRRRRSDDRMEESRPRWAGSPHSLSGLVHARGGALPPRQARWRPGLSAPLPPCPVRRTCRTHPAAGLAAAPVDGPRVGVVVGVQVDPTILAIRPRIHTPAVPRVGVRVALPPGGTVAVVVAMTVTGAAGQRLRRGAQAHAHGQNRAREKTMERPHGILLSNCRGHLSNGASTGIRESNDMTSLPCLSMRGSSHGPSLTSSRRNFSVSRTGRILLVSVP